MHRLNLSFRSQRMVRAIVTALRGDTNPSIFWNYTPGHITFPDDLPSKPGAIEATIDELREMEALGLLHRNRFTLGGQGSLDVDLARATAAVDSRFGHRVRDLMLHAVYELAGKKVAVPVDESAVMDLAEMDRETVQMTGISLERDGLLKSQWHGSLPRPHYTYQITPKGWAWFNDPDAEPVGYQINVLGDGNAIAAGAGAFAQVTVNDSNALKAVIGDMKRRLDALSAQQLTIGRTLDALISAMEAVPPDAEKVKSLWGTLWEKSKDIMGFASDAAAVAQCINELMDGQKP